ncbi:hypothetical protein K3740_01865 [Ruegeria conchae]|uniref:hypothetical protein n=1 Tax=Ruegeria conchae TaxID=981384 RepID=UPI0021A5C722|nr:hypothetical protein [Ruegeria conchae]UWR03484.1 hypothetical protein K3740_01865 [Ruegeria conchae]
MSKKLSEDQIAMLVQVITQNVLDAVSSPEEQTRKRMEKTAQTVVLNRDRGRKLSPYTGQLHLKVLPEDEEWFKELRKQINVQNGKLFHLFRRFIDDNASISAAEFQYINRVQ